MAPLFAAHGCPSQLILRIAWHTCWPLSVMMVQIGIASCQQNKTEHNRKSQVTYSMTLGSRLFILPHEVLVGASFPALSGKFNMPFAWPNMHPICLLPCSTRSLFWGTMCIMCRVMYGSLIKSYESKCRNSIGSVFYIIRNMCINVGSPACEKLDVGIHKRYQLLYIDTWNINVEVKQ